MKYLILLFTLILMACANTSAVPLSSMGTGRAEMNQRPANMTATVAAKSARATADLPARCHAPSDRVHVFLDNQGNYCFLYPARFRLGEFEPGQPGIFGPNLDNSDEPVYTSLQVTAKPAEGRTLETLVNLALDEYKGMPGVNITRRTLTIAGEPAIMADGVPGYLSSRIVFVLHDDTLYQLRFWPAGIDQAQADLTELFDTVVSSFTTLEPVS